MVDISNKLSEIENLIESDFYFVINRPRQYGKTTTLNELYNRLKNKYTVIDISFEGIDEKLFEDSKLFCNEFIDLMKESIDDQILLNEFREVDNISELSELISDITSDREIILLIDEVDKSPNNKLLEYSKVNKLNMNISELSNEIYKFTSGYPFLVGRICQIVDENIIGDIKRVWEIKDIHVAIKNLLNEHNTLFDDLIKNLENNNELYKLIESLLIFDVEKKLEMYNPEINLGYMFGYLKNENGYVKVANIIFSELIYNYMISKINDKEMSNYNFKKNFITMDNGLDIRKVLLKFRQFMKVNYSDKDVEFLETQ